MTDIKGLSIRKTIICKKLRNQLTELLTEYILKPKRIDIKAILDRLDQIEEEIEESLKNGETTYSLPKNIELISNYANPASLEPVRGAVVWNALEPNQQIVPPEKVNIIKLKTTVPDHPALLEMKEKYPDKYNIIMNYCFNKDAAMDISNFGFSVIALPKSVEAIPEYLRNCVDYDTMANYNTSNALILLESLGIFTAEEADTTKYKSNIIEM